MKKSIKNILLGGTIVGCLLSGCTPFDELNADPTRLNEANPGPDTIQYIYFRVETVQRLYL